MKQHYQYSYVNSTLTAAVPGEADPEVVTFGDVEASDELHLRSAVDGRQICVGRLAVMSGVGPREALWTVVHMVTVATVGKPERQTLSVTGGRSGWRIL